MGTSMLINVKSQMFFLTITKKQSIVEDSDDDEHFSARMSMTTPISSDCHLHPSASEVKPKQSPF